MEGEAESISLASILTRACHVLLASGGQPWLEGVVLPQTGVLSLPGVSHFSSDFSRALQPADAAWRVFTSEFDILKLEQQLDMTLRATMLIAANIIASNKLENVKVSIKELVVYGF